MHYKNGREARVGDRVVGRCYNMKGVVSGTLVSVTPGPDMCSAKVGFLKTFPVASVVNNDYQHPSYIGPADKVVAVQGTEQHGSSGPLAVTVYAEDYTHCANLLHADDVAEHGVLVAGIMSA